MKEIKVPTLAESITEGTIAKWLAEEGEEVERNKPIVELETDKVNVEILAEASGVLEKITKQEGTDVQVGETLGHIKIGAKEDKRNDKDEFEKRSKNKESDVQVKNKLDRDLVIPMTPSLRRRVREAGISLETFSKNMRASLQNKSSAIEEQPEPMIEKAESNENQKKEIRRPLSRRRRTIANRLLHATQESAMLTTFNEVDMSRVIELRKEKNDRFIEKHGIKLGFMSFFTKAVVFALQEYPILNAELDDNNVIEKNYYDIGIAVASDDGLVVPVIRNADSQSFAEIEQEIKRLSSKVQNNELSISDLSGGTFTITNGGVFGSLFSTPILNRPQVGILGMHTIQKRPIALPDDTVQVRPMMYIALSYDHQLVDGKEAVLFLKKVKELVENPEDLLFDL